MQSMKDFYIFFLNCTHFSAENTKNCTHFSAIMELFTLFHCIDNRKTAYF